MKYKFRVGDKVKVIDSGYGFPPEDIGKTSTIVKIGEYCDGPHIE